MGCDLWGAIAASGLGLELAAVAVMLFGSLAAPLFQLALGSFLRSLVGFADCMLMM